MVTMSHRTQGSIKYVRPPSSEEKQLNAGEKREITSNLPGILQNKCPESGFTYDGLM